MNDEDRTLIDHALFQRDMQIKQLRHEQLSPYLRIWVLSMEALLTGFGILWTIAIGWTLLTDGFAEAVAIAETLTVIAAVTAVGLTLFLRITWMSITAGKRAVGSDAVE